MKTQKLLFLFFIFLIFSCKGQTKKINGLSFVASADKINTTHIEPVIRVQSNYVALMPFGFIKNLSSPQIIHNTERQWFGETEKGVYQYGKEFQKKEIQLMIKPQIWVWQGEYTGFIAMNSEQEWTALEASYSEFILTYAKVAEALKASIFCIGTELEKFVATRPTYWLRLIKEIRKVYKGKLTYAANWNEFSHIDFWKEIDYIGIDAYFPLSDKKTPTVQEFEDGWKSHKNEIISVQKKYGKLVVFTEFGYRSIDFAGKEPWRSEEVKNKVNLEAQANGLQAIYNQFWKEDWFLGGFVWKWFHKHNEVGGNNNNRFTPQNKQAEDLLKKIYEN